MHDPASSETLRSARRRFFETGQAPSGLVPETIAASWRRCRAFGLAADARLRAEPPERHALRALRQPYEALCRLCRPEMEALYADAEATGSVVILTAPDGLVLEAMGHADFLDRAARVALQPGVTWSEDHTGTNAIGTALYERGPVAVHGAEHYFGAHRVLACAASPILDGRGRTVGLLDLSGDARIAQVHAMGMLRFAVDQIERRLLERELAGREVIRLHADAALLGTHREGILVFEDHHLVAANRYALDMLGVDWSELGRCRYDQLFTSARPRQGTVQTLRGPGDHPYQARSEQVPALLTRASRPAPPPPHRRPAAKIAPVFQPAVDRALTRCSRLLDADIPILLYGETGTGKEVAARELHLRSERAGGPFVAVNCAALPESLIEAELFGYRSGAFTGARRGGAPGLLREADGGVLFLDEIGDMPLTLQSRLLRVLQEREITPLGGGSTVHVDFAVIAASHRRLHEEIAAGRFRSDLFYRIAQFRYDLPALRDHPDLAGLIRELWHALGADAAGMPLTTDAIERLAARPWPGNMRELLGVLRSTMALADPGHSVQACAWPEQVCSPATTAAATPAATSLEAIRTEAMRDALAACNGNMSKAARQLGIHRSTLYRRLKN